MEKYGGEKFRTVFLSNKAPSTKKSKELIRWFRKFSKCSLAPEYNFGSSGNLSFRYKKGFVIKSTKTYFRTIKEDELVYAERFDMKKKIAYVHGKLEPSTELQMHLIIYNSKKNVSAIFHLHDYSVMKKAKKLGIPITKVTEAGTEKIGYDVADKLKKSDYVIMKNHGIVAVGKNIKETGNLILKYHELALENNE